MHPARHSLIEVVMRGYEPRDDNHAGCVEAILRTRWRAGADCFNGAV
jgi:hypothetical protein